MLKGVNTRLLNQHGHPLNTRKVAKALFYQFKMLIRDFKGKKTINIIFYLK